MQVHSYTTVEAFEKRTLPNGLRVLAQHVPATYSVVLGVFVHVGSRDEEPRLAGISHFVEHMVFKGTQRRTAFDLALALERVGGSLEAHTTKEYTCFYTRVLREHFDLALDVLSDLVLNPTHPPDQLGARARCRGRGNQQRLRQPGRLDLRDPGGAVLRGACVGAPDPGDARVGEWVDPGRFTLLHAAGVRRRQHVHRCGR